MSTIVLITLGVILAIVIMSKLPGLEHFVKPIVGLLFTFLQAALENLWSWGIFLFKLLLYSHTELVQHLLRSEDSLDPSIKMKNNGGPQAILDPESALDRRAARAWSSLKGMLAKKA